MGESVDQWLEHDDLIRFFNELADRIGDSTSENEYGEQTSVFFTDGKGLLDYAETSPEFTPESFMGCYSEDTEDAELFEHLKYLMVAFRAYVPEWRKSIDKHGTLTFYVD